MTGTQTEILTSGLEPAPEAQAGVRCEDLVVKYGEHTAVDGVTFTARAGEVLGLLGPNGAGKTSVIRALTTIVPREAGQAELAGVPIENDSAVRAHVGVLPESTGYPGHQTAIDYLRYHGELYGLSAAEAERRGRVLLETFGLGRRMNTRIKTFSRGMRQRLGISRALINEPKVLFLDEPTLGLDPAGQEEILRLIREIARGGSTVIVCSHLLDEVERTCDRVTIMHRGRVVAEGEVPEVIRAAGVPARAQLRVPADQTEQAVALLDGRVPRGRPQPAEARPGELDIELRAGVTGNELISLVVSAGIPLLSFKLEGAHLSDAFLALTRESGDKPDDI